jgi:hypothetical protein
MRSLLARFLLLIALAWAVPSGRAFSLMGALDTWQTVELGYQIGADIGGPMNLGEEYRLNVPMLTFGFDESFLNYFGTKGAEEIEKAMQTFNDLPAVSTLSEDLSEYPLDTRRFNHRASALYLYDLRSYVMATMLEFLGLAPPERYVWTLRSRVVIGDIPYYSVIKRNFDPVTWEPSSYVNGTLYTYLILQTYTDPVYEAVEFEVDPSQPSVSSVAGFNIDAGTVAAAGYFANISPGLFYTGLTRDDVAGLRYLYRPDNFNIESIATNAVTAPLAARAGNYIIGSGSSGGGGGGWGDPGGGTNVVGTTNLAVNVALRPGVDKVTFVRVDYDSMLGSWTVITNRFVDRYVTNYALRTQQLERTLAQPDILFTAADLGPTPAGDQFVFVRTIPYVNLDPLNGTTTLGGPGLVDVPLVMTFSKVGQYLLNIGDGGEVDGLPNFWWGTYDGTPTEPIVYPVGASIKTLERLILEGAVSDSSENPWLAPPILTTTTGGTTTGTGTATAGGDASFGGGTTP